MNLSTSTTQGWQTIHVEGQVDSKTVTVLRDYIDSELRDGLAVALEIGRASCRERV